MGHLPLHRHRSQQNPQVLVRVAKDLLQLEALLGVGLLRGHVCPGQLVENQTIGLHPFSVGLALHVAALDLLVPEDATLFEIDTEDLARVQPLLDEDVLGRDLDAAYLGAHDHEAVLRDDVARGPQAVAVQDGPDLSAIGEGERGRPVPGLQQEGVVLVEGPQVGIHVVAVLPGASGTIMRIASGRSRPDRHRNSSALSKRAESEAPSRQIG